MPSFFCLISKILHSINIDFTQIQAKLNLNRKQKGESHMATSAIFKRVEKKYLIQKEQYQKLLELLKEHMMKDEYGEYTICNLYYDTQEFDLIRNSLDKPIYKEKLRLRSYGTPERNSKVFLELKKKYQGVVYKRRISLTLEEAHLYLENGIMPNEQGQIFKEIDFFLKQYHPDPKIYIAYDREAYAGIEDSEFRITFDRNIRSRTHTMLLERDSTDLKLLNENLYLMEIKVKSALPNWLVDFLSEEKIYPCSFSKYGKFYQEFLCHEKKLANY